MAKAPVKIYVVDNGFVESAAFNLSENLGRLLENQVFVELVRRGYDVGKTLFYYHTRNDREIDFVMRDGTKVERLIQVCYDLSGEKTRKREFDALVEAAGELHCDDLTVVTATTNSGLGSTLEWKGKKIKIVTISQF